VFRDTVLFFHFVFNAGRDSPNRNGAQQSALHGPEARHNVFKGTGQQMPVMRQPWQKAAIVKDKGIAFFVAARLFSKIFPCSKSQAHCFRLRENRPPAKPA